jgi:hypothetical protein
MKRFRRQHRSIFVAAVMAVATHLAAAEPLPPLVADDPPLDAAQRKKISQLITQLGDVTWKKRQEATESLQHLGDAVLPFLREAQQDPDPEIQARADALIKTIAPPIQIEDETVISAPGGLRITGNLVSQGRLVISGGGEAGITITTTARFPFKGRQFTVVRKTDGKTTTLRVEITEPGDGEETRRVVETNGEEDLAQREPELLKILKKRAVDLAERQTKLRGQYSQMTGIP